MNFNLDELRKLLNDPEVKKALDAYATKEEWEATKKGLGEQELKRLLPYILKVSLELPELSSQPGNLDRIIRIAKAEYGTGI